MSHLKIESARRQLGTALALFLVAAVLAFAAPAHAQQQGDADQKMCYGAIPRETMNALVHKSIAKVGGPQLAQPVDNLIYGMLQHEVSVYLGVYSGDKIKGMPAFLITNDTRLAARAMTACFTEVQEAVAKQQDLIRESKRPVNQLFMAYKLYSHVQFCNEVRQGYMVVWINEVELERARQATKAIEKVALAENPEPRHRRPMAQGERCRERLPRVGLVMPDGV